MEWIPELPTSANTMKIWSPKQRRFFTNPKYEAAKKKIRQLMSLQPVCYTTPVSLSVFFHLRNTEKVWDLDNHCKAVMDALTGIAYTDDKLVRELVARIDRIPKGAAEGFLYDVQPYTVQETPEPHFEPYTLPLPAEKAAAEDNDVRRRI